MIGPTSTAAGLILTEMLQTIRDERNTLNDRQPSGERHLIE